MEDIKERVEDAMIHFDDMGYKWDQSLLFGFKEDPLGYYIRLGFSGIVRSMDSNDSVNLKVCIHINIRKKSSVFNFVDWNEHNSNLKSAIMRINRWGGDVHVQSTGTNDMVFISKENHKLKNLKDLDKTIRTFNQEHSINKLTSNLKYHPELGVGIYIIEQKNKEPEAVTEKEEE